MVFVAIPQHQQVRLSNFALVIPAGATRLNAAADIQMDVLSQSSEMIPFAPRMQIQRM